MSKLLEDVRHLAGTIGPRGTGTPAEAEAADYVSRRLADLGLAPEKHAFGSVPSQNAFPIAISLLALASTAIYLQGGTAARWLAAALSFFAAWSLWQTIRSAFNPISVLIPKIISQNVEARLRPKNETRRKAVLLAHLDTNRCRLVWQSMSVRALTPMTWLTLAVPVGMGLLYLAGAILGGTIWWFLSLPFAAYQLGTIVTLLRDDRTPYSPGAHDNAASVAVALEMAKRLSSAPLQNTEVWFVFDGAEETDHAGALDLLRRHGAELREAAFFGLEGLGSGEIVYLTRQGLIAYYHPSPDLLKAAESVAAKYPELKFSPAEMVAEDDVRALRGRGCRAICLAGRDPQTGILPRWHRPDDTPEFVSEETMSRAADILCALLKEMDQ
ncbi:MAG: M20/M25/M40 family metallo-hydrolase [Chloroflexi bacterium]|nr:M20/M25/M40 family metallo-hydrolase [Chloroflexota bacterium]